MPNNIININTVIVAVKLAAKFKHSFSLFKYYCNIARTAHVHSWKEILSLHYMHIFDVVVFNCTYYLSKQPLCVWYQAWECLQLWVSLSLTQTVSRVFPKLCPCSATEVTTQQWFTPQALTTLHSRFEEDKIRFKENISALLQRARNSICVCVWGGGGGGSINHATNNVKYLKKSA